VTGPSKTPDWESIEDAYGPADQVPVLLHQSVNADPDVWEEAIEDLSSRLCESDGSVAPASAAAVPFLLAVAGSRDVPHRDQHAELVYKLAEVAFGPLGEDFTDEADAREAVRQVLRTHHDTLLGLLSDNAVRDQVVGVLAHVVHGDAVRTAAYVRVLAELRPQEPEPASRFAILAALEQLAAPDAIRPALTDPAPAPRLLAALALLPHDAPGSPSWILVRDALAEPDRYEPAWGEAVWVCTPLGSLTDRFDWTHRICAAGADAARFLLPGLLDLVSRSSGITVSRRLRPLLDLFFPVPPPPVPDAVQAAIADAVSRHAGYLSGSTGLLSNRQLPYRAQSLRAYAESGPAGRPA
jgi:hypothetical protein